MTRGIALAAIVAAIGAVVFRRLLLDRWPSGGDPPVPWARRASTVGIAAAIAIALVAPIRLYCQAHALVEAPDPVMPMMSNVLQTRWGHALELQIVVALVGSAAFSLAARDRRGAWTIALFAVLALSLTPAFMGHAIATQRGTFAAVAGDWLHVVAAGAWIGTLSVMVWACASARATPEGGPAVATLVDLFHPVALSAATIILATGIFSAWLRLDHFRDLYTSMYGALLLTKLVLVAIVLTLGRYHSRSASRIARAGGTGAVFRSLALEVVFAALVLGVTAVLVGTSPPMAA